MKNRSEDNGLSFIMQAFYTHFGKARLNENNYFNCNPVIYQFSFL